MHIQLPDLSKAQLLSAASAEYAAQSLKLAEEAQQMRDALVKRREQGKLKQYGLMALGAVALGVAACGLLPLVGGLWTAVAAAGAAISGGALGHALGGKLYVQAAQDEFAPLKEKLRSQVAQLRVHGAGLQQAIMKENALVTQRLAELAAHQPNWVERISAQAQQHAPGRVLH